MRITLVRFRTYVDSITFDFSRAAITLIAGSSGLGKSTILEAIYWGLFGSMLHIYPTGTTGSAKEPTCVLLEFPEAGNIFIRRRRPPEIIEVGLPPIPTSSGGDGGTEYKVLVGDSAQAQINALFGSKELWMASAYLRQTTRSPLITMPSSEKFQLLHELTFGDAADSDTHDFYIAKLDAELYRIKDFLTSHTGRFNALTETYTQSLTVHRDAFTVWGTRAATVDAVTALHGDVVAAEAALVVCRTKYQSTREIEVRVAEAEVAIAAAQRQLAELRGSVFDAHRIDELQVEKASLRRALDQHAVLVQVKRRIHDLTTKQAALSVLPNHTELSVEAAGQRRQELDIIQRQYAAFTALGCTPTTCQSLVEKCDATLKTHTEQRLAHTAWEAEVARIITSSKEIDIVYQEQCAKVRDEHRILTRERQQLIDNNTLLTKTHQAQQQAVQLQRQQYTRYEQDMAAYHTNTTKQAEAGSAVLALKAQSEEHRAWYLETYPGAEPTLGVMEAKIHELQMLLQELACPHCAQGVTLTAGRLERGHSTPEARGAATATITRLRAFIDLTKDMDRRRAYATSLPTPIMPAIVDLPPPPPEEPAYTIVLPLPALILPPRPTVPPLPAEPRIDVDAKGIEQMRHRRDQLIALTAPTVSLSIVDTELASLSALATHREFSASIVELTAQLNTTTLDSVSAELRLKEIETQLVAQHKLQAQTAMLEAQLAVPASHVRPIPSSIDLQADIHTLEAKIKELTAAYHAGLKVIEIVGQKANLDTTHKTLLQYAGYEGNLVRLKALISEVATSAMDTVVANINETANLILKDLFIEDVRSSTKPSTAKDIRILLATHRQLKTKDKVKLQVNLQVYYGGNEYDSPSQLSGGEQDRISFAITLALAKINPSPLVLLDECMSALDRELRERCLKVLRLHLPHKTIVHVCHEIVEGFHDTVLRLGA